MVRLSIFVLAISVCAAESHAQIQIKKVTQDLVKRDRRDRVNALEMLEIKREFPPEVIDPLKESIELETDAIREPFASLAADTPDALKVIPHDSGDDSLDRIKSKYEEFVGSGDLFTIVGIVRNSSYFNFGMSSLPTNYYSFEFMSITPSGKKELGDRAHLYAIREFGDGLVEFASRAKEQGKLAIVRVKGHISADRIDGHEDQALSHLEATDWQYYNPDTEDWEPWVLGPSELAFHLLGKSGTPAIPVLVDFVGIERLVVGKRIDAVRRLNASFALESMDDKAKLEAIAIIGKRLPKAKFDHAKEWLASSANGLRRKLKTSGPGLKTSKAPQSAAAKAATLLGMAKNLEKSKKQKAAIDYYNRLINEHPDSDEAKVARERLDAMGGKK